MLYTVLKSIAILFYPWTLMIIGLIVVLLWWKKRFARYVLLMILLGFYLCANGVIPTLLIKPLESNLQTVSLANIKQHRAMVVLGAGLNIAPNGVTPEILGYSRILEAYSIYYRALQNNSHYLVFLSGGISSDDGHPISEARRFKTILINMGVPAKQIITENKSQNTRENAEFIKPLLDQYHIKSVLLVTGGLHMRRALGYFKAFSITAIPAPSDFPYPKISLIPSSENFYLTEEAVHEWLGQVQLYLFNTFNLN
ncbi:MAG: YdcF family protein [Pseudomonadota bacterium]